MNIIVGLGNLSQEYENTRHNIGFMVLDKLAHHFGLSWRTNKKLKAQIIDCDGFYLVKPLTFMNDSGAAVAAVMSYYKILPQQFSHEKKQSPDLTDKLTVIHDELDLPLGKYKISLNSRSAGHKGAQSIIDHLETKKFKRIRIGIKTEQANNMPAEKFVLSHFRPAELAIVNKQIEKIIGFLAK